jgi:hypothetical protein
MYQENAQYTMEDRKELITAVDIESLVDFGFDSEEELKKFIKKSRQEIEASLDTEIIQDKNREDILKKRYHY